MDLDSRLVQWPETNPYSLASTPTFDFGRQDDVRFAEVRFTEPVKGVVDLCDHAAFTIPVAHLLEKMLRDDLLQRERRALSSNEQSRDLIS